MDILCVIPARLGSTRLPRKILAPIHGKPLVQWVYEAAKKVSCFREVILAVDDQETQKVAEGFGARALMTAKECHSGTDRLIELMLRGEIKADIIVNWQGDEPMIEPEVIDQLLQTAGKDGCSIWTLCRQIQDGSSPHDVKVVRTYNHEALYFSRSPIPYYHEGQKKIYYKHIGLYAYSMEGLKMIAGLPPSSLEEAERLEQLRFLQGGLKIKVHETDHEIFGIDTPQQLETAKLHLST